MAIIADCKLTNMSNCSKLQINKYIKLQPIAKRQIYQIAAFQYEIRTATKWTTLSQWVFNPFVCFLKSFSSPFPVDTAYHADQCILCNYLPTPHPPSHTFFLCLIFSWVLIIWLLLTFSYIQVFVLLPRDPGAPQSYSKAIFCGQPWDLQCGGA